MSGNKISIKTLDLNKDFSEIRKQLDKIVYNHFYKLGGNQVLDIYFDDGTADLDNVIINPMKYFDFKKRTKVVK